MSAITGNVDSDEEGDEVVVDPTTGKQVHKHHSVFFKKIIQSSKNNALKKLKDEFDLQNIGGREDEILDVEEVRKNERALLKAYVH